MKDLSNLSIEPLREWFHLSPDPVFILDKEGFIVECSKSSFKVYGYTREELIGKQITEIFLPESLHVFMTNFPRLQQKIPQEGEISIICKDNSVIDVWCKGVPLTDSNDIFQGVLVFQREITQIKKLQDKLKKKSEHLETILSNIKEGIIFLDKNDNIIYANKMSGKLYNFNPNKIIGKNIFNIHPKKTIQKTTELIDKIKKEKTFFNSIRRINNKNIEFELYRIEKENNYNGIIAILRDITKQLETEKEKEKTISQLYQLQKLDAIGMLAGGIAHNLNNLLNAIQGNIEIALINIKKDLKVKKFLKLATETTQEAAELIRQLLLFSKNKSTKKTIQNINIICKDAIKLCKPFIEKSISIKTILQDNIWLIEADPHSLQQIIINLIINARDALPYGGTITIKTRNITINSKTKNPKSRPGEFICLSIRDDGSGMSSDILNHLFEPFFTTKSIKGTGLGLSIVYGIVTDHKGWIDIESEPNTGTQFNIFFPRINKQYNNNNIKTYIDNQLVSGNGEKILVVEDEDVVRDFVKSVLVEHSYNVTCVKTAKEALKIFLKDYNYFDLALVNILLPDGSGIELVDKLLEINPRLDIIFSSGYQKETCDTDTLIHKKRFDYISKPYPIITLLKAIRKTLDNK